MHFSFSREAVKQIEKKSEFLYLKMNLLIQKLAGIYNAQIPYKTTEIFPYIDALHNHAL